MKQKLFTLVTLLIFTGHALAFDQTLITKESILYKPTFSKSYSLYPRLPKGILEAVAFSYTRIQNHTYNDQSPISCTGLPRTYGVMGLTKNGKGYFKNNLSYVAELSGFNKTDILNDAHIGILAYAAALNSLMEKHNVRKNDFKKITEILRTLSELPNYTVNQDFALNSQLYVMFWFMSKHEFQVAFDFSDHHIDMPSIFGEDNYKILSSSKIVINSNGIKGDNNVLYEKMSGPCEEYPGALWVAADPSNYSSRNGASITAITIHDIEGTYAGAISWFQNPSANVSAHYNMRSIDGQVTQMVCEADKAWHVGTENAYTIGIEHEGLADYQGWYTNTMFKTSADICVDLSQSHPIDIIRTYDGPPQYQINTLGSCIKIKGHQHYQNSNHRDPGLNWDWEYFYRLINESSTNSPIVYSSASGNIYDSGGPTSNYGNDERSFWLIQPTGANEVILNFTEFEIELNWDYLYIYDGNSVHDELIGKYTGTNGPGTITGKSGKILLEFRSDCATIDQGWSANYTSNNNSSNCETPYNLTESNITMSSVNCSWISTASEYVFRYKDQTYNPWTYVYTNSNNHQITGLPSNSEIYWGVAAICNNDTSAYTGGMVETPIQNGAFSINSCNGKFNDSGGSEGVYLHYEDWEYTINALDTITVSFQAFDVESGYDYLYAYDGPSIYAPQFPGSPFSGNSIPQDLISSGNSITFKFTSDIATTADGWEASWSCSGNNSFVNVQSATFQNFIQMFPNPAFEQLTISSTKVPYELTFFDLNGKIISNDLVKNKIHQLDLSSLSKGMYFVKAGNQTNKLIVE